MNANLERMVNKARDRFFTVPNFFSFVRVLLIPVFLIMLARQNRLGALIVFFIAASTDLLDGITARLLNQKSKLGAFLDPAGDKLLMTAGIIALSLPSLSSPNVIPIWLTGVVIGRDLYIVTGVFILYKRTGRKSFSPIMTGKISTVCQMSVLILVLFFNTQNTTPLLLLWIYILTLTFAILSGIQYTHIGRQLYKNAARNT